MKGISLGILCSSLWVAGSLPVLADTPQGSPAANHQYRLEKVVELIRHGVRSPTNTPEMTDNTGRQWPTWSVADGDLTGHGYMGMAQQGAYDLAQWKALGLSLSNEQPSGEQQCPTGNQVFLWSDTDQRTKATGIALADGMFPGCGIYPQWSKHHKDPLFSAASMNLSSLNTQQVKKEVMEKMGGSSDAAASHYRQDVDVLRQAVCSSKEGSCHFLSQPWGVAFTKSGKAKLTGPVSEGSTIGESIRLEYSEGLPLDQVAFGHAHNAHEVEALMRLHAAKYDLLSDTPTYASYGGSVLMQQLINALSHSSSQNNPALKRPLVILVGHDTNIAQIQTMLGFNWHLPGYPRNDIPPGGNLEFQLYRDTKDGSQWVRVMFEARTLDQWRSLTPLNNHNPLPTADFHGEGCKHTSVGELCPLKSVTSQMAKHLVHYNSSQNTTPIAVFH